MNTAVGMDGGDGIAAVLFMGWEEPDLEKLLKEAYALADFTMKRYKGVKRCDIKELIGLGMQLSTMSTQLVGMKELFPMRWDEIHSVNLCLEDAKRVVRRLLKA